MMNEKPDTDEEIVSMAKLIGHFAWAWRTFASMVGSKVGRYIKFSHTILMMTVTQSC